jgi:hypothetical protein
MQTESSVLMVDGRQEVLLCILDIIWSLGEPVSKAPCRGLVWRQSISLWANVTDEINWTQALLHELGVSQSRPVCVMV